ncbi:MAG TPA: DUF3592 domain-containing protein [Pirellulaceae bacterium]|nr:DUF3592 domain-containing protein [Pirellulaceae bacterium]
MHQVSTRKIILNDYVAFLLTIGGPIALAISAFTAVFGFIPSIRNRGGQEVDPQFIIGMCVVAVVLTLLLFFLLWRRIARIRNILATGPRTKAKVLGIGFFKDRGRIDFEYTHNGQQYATGTAVMKNQQTTSIAAGDEIEVALDPENPLKALIVHLYEG